MSTQSSSFRYINTTTRKPPRFPKYFERQITGFYHRVGDVIKVSPATRVSLRECQDFAVSWRSDYKIDFNLHAFKNQVFFFQFAKVLIYMNLIGLYQLLHAF